MAADLPLLPTTVVGSYAHPSWFYAAKELMEADRFGPTDVEETFDDAVDRAIADQVEAGLDIVSDGEMRRASFVWAFASRMTGLRDAGPLRKMGPDVARHAVRAGDHRTGRRARRHGSGRGVHLRQHADRPAGEGAAARTLRPHHLHPPGRPLLATGPSWPRPSCRR